MSASVFRRQVAAAQRGVQPRRLHHKHAAARKRRLFFEPLEERSLLAAVITVNSTLDANARDDFLTLREAILINNRTLAVASLTAAEQAQVVGTPTSGDRDTIGFNIPGSGVKTIAVTTQLPTLSDAATIDGYTQPGSIANTNAIDDPDPSKRGFNGTLLIELTRSSSALEGLILANGSTVRGLVINGFGHNGINVGSDCIIEGNFIGTDATGTLDRGNSGSGIVASASNNRIGGTSPASRNVISSNGFWGIGIQGPGTPTTGNIVQGNFIGTDASGTKALGNEQIGVFVSQASSNTIGGVQAGSRNIVSSNGFLSNGSGIYIESSSSNTVQGNFVGVDVKGTQPLGNASFGIVLASGGNNLVGGSIPGAGNVVADSKLGGGIGLTFTSQNTIQGNYIGTDPSGTLPLGNTGDGVGLFRVTSTNLVGGTSAGAANIIAFNRGSGVHLLADSGSGNSVRANSIFSNAGLGIDIGGATGGVSDGVTANDSGDADAGPNRRQNFPEISSADLNAGTLTVNYVVSSSTANSAYPLRVEFFRADSAGQEGQVFVGADTYLASEANTLKTFAFATPVAFSTTDRLLATATDNNGNTSEFSASVAVLISNCLTVTNTLDSGPGSLRAAINCANSTPNVDGPDAGSEPDADVIRFAIPGAGVKTIAPLTALPAITEAVVIDGYSQPGASVNTLAVGDNAVLMVELSGVSAGAGANGLTINGSESTVKGLVINRFAANGILLQLGGGNTIAGNFIGTDSTGSAALGNGATGVRVFNSVNNTIGGTETSERNVISGNLDSGVYVVGSSAAGNVVAGNYVGLAASGITAVGNSPDGIVTQAPLTTIGGTLEGAGNVISGNSRAGVVLSSGTVESTVAGNLIGVNAAGTAGVGNQAEGIGVHGGAESNLIGGAVGNVVSGNVLDGIILFGGATQNDIAGNFLGTSLGGSAAIPNGRNGILVSGAANNTIRGGNTIAHNGGAGVVVLGAAAVGNSIVGNSIFDNAGLGIDLDEDGITFNDLGDGDTGPNGLQNFPEITGVTTAGTDTIISGRLESTPDSLFRLEFFASDLDPAGLGEGQSLLGTMDVTTNASGTVFFTTPGLAGVVPAGRVVTATATTRVDDDQNPNTPLVLADTSEFSTAICSLIVTSALDSGPGSLREAIRCANTVSNIDRNGLGGPDPDPITFAIPGGGVQTITLASSLPEISEAVMIDGYTQPGASVNSLLEGNDAVLLVEINAAAAGGLTGVLQITGGSSTVRGLVINRSPGAAIVVPAATGASNRFEGNFLGTNAAGDAALPNGGGIFVATPANVIGGDTPGARNVIVTTGDAVRISSGQVVALGTVVKGNYLGTNAAGTAALPAGSLGAHGVFVEGAAINTIGGSGPGSRNVIGNFGVGVSIFGSTASVNFVQGNYIGTNAEGRGALPNGVGIRIGQGAGQTHNSGNVVGGAEAGAGNVISGNGAGIVIESDFNTVQGNFIGVDNGGGSAVPNAGAGIQIEQNAVSNLIGGTIDGAGNVIANNGAGIVLASGTGNSLLRNSIHSNAGLGIDLVSGAPGATPNDAGDADEGPNRLQNFPEIISAVPSDFGGITITYFVPTAEANATYPLRIEFFRADADGQEGEIFLGVDTFTLDDFAAGPKTILLSPVAGIGLGDRLLATATDSRGILETPNNTSEFSRSMEVGDVSTCGLVVVNTNDSGLGSLREAINCANTTPNVDRDGDSVVDPDLISFAIPANDPRHFYYRNDAINGGLRNITVTTAADDTTISNIDPDWRHSWFSIEVITSLPSLSEAAIVDGYSQPGARTNTNGPTMEGNAVLRIELTEALASAGNEISGFVLTADASTVKGFAINRFDLHGIQIQSDGNIVAGNYIGTDVSSENDLGNGGDGININSQESNLIGGSSASARNYIRDNVGSGVALVNGSSRNTVQGNSIVRNTTAPIVSDQTKSAGILVDESDRNTIGGVTGGSGNVISGNTRGVLIVGSGASGNILQGNTIGFGNSQGVIIRNAHDNLVGGTIPLARNVISGNTIGVQIESNIPGLASFNNVLQGNYIGPDSTGLARSSHQSIGVFLIGHNSSAGTFANTIGGLEAGAGNVVSGNADSGITILGPTAANNSIQGNFIGVGADGSSPLGNVLGGTSLGGVTFGNGTHDNVVGGAIPAARNVISANNYGVFISEPDVTGNLIEGNYIGTDVTGMLDRGNRSPGVFLHSQTSSNTIRNNLISGNGRDGIELQAAGSSNLIQGNFIGTAADGTSALPNDQNGILVQSDDNNTIGGSAAGQGNIIAFNQGAGILVPRLGPRRLAILGNSIFSNALIGIDLSAGDFSPDGVTPNDAGDADIGPNNLQNFPEISTANLDGPMLEIEYAVPSSTANSAYPLRVEFFVADSSGQEGKTFLGFDSYLGTDANSVKTFTFVPGAAILDGDRIVATATDAVGNTSEFSASITVQAAVCSLIVTNTNDSGPGSLREAINCANGTANVDRDGLAGADADGITFAIPASDPRHFYYVNDGVAGSVSRVSVAATTAATDGTLVNPDPDWPHSWFSIEVGSVLPEITEGVVIDGYTQAGARQNTQEVGSDAVLKVEVSGREDMPLAEGGFVVKGGGSTLRGLIVNQFGNLLQGGMPGIVLPSDANFVQGNFIGTDASGTLALGDVMDGVMVAAGGANNHVGGTARAARNLISGNGNHGIIVGGFNDGLAGPIGTRIVNNYIGTNADGTAAVANGFGVLLVKGLNTVIGGDDDDDGLADGVVASRNLISGNVNSGITVNPRNTTAVDVIVQGNFVGVDAAGTAALPNLHGIMLTGGFIDDNDAQVGGVTPGAGNVLSGNHSLGLFVSNVQTLSVQGNLIGTDKSGTQAIGNGEGGISLGIYEIALLDYAVTIGGMEPGSGNVISGNGAAFVGLGFGMRADNAQVGGSLTIQRNLVGTQIDGVTPLPNRGPGIDLARPALVGSLNPALGNVIAHNDGSGVVVREFDQPGDRGVAILGNSIFANGLFGIDLGDNGVTANDLTPTADVDEGPNRLQNFPVISAATADGDSLTISYFVPSAQENSTYPIRVEFFLADANGQGRMLIGSDEFGLDDFAADSRTIEINPLAAIVPGNQIVATATDSVPAVQAGFIGPLAVSAGEPNNTSEFGASFTVRAPIPPIADLSVTKSDGALAAIPGTSVTYTIVVSNAGPAAVSGVNETQTVSVSGVFASGYRLTFNNQTTAPIAITAIAGEVRDALNGLATIGGVGGHVEVGQTGNVYTITFGGTLAGQDVSQLTATTIGNIAVTINTLEQGKAAAILNDVFPASLTNVSYSSQAALGASGNTAIGSGNIFDNLSLPAGASVTYTVTGVISPSATGTLSNTASVTAPEGITDANPGNNSATDVDELTPRADLSITKTDGVASVAAGATLTYTIVVSNAGPSAVTGATVTDFFPAAFLGPVFTATGSGGASGFSGGGGNISQNVNLPVNSSVTYIVTGTVSASAGGTLSNTASVNVPVGVSDLNAANNSAVDSDTIIATAPNVGLVIGADGHSRGRPVVGVYDNQGVRLRKFLAYENNYRGGVRVALGDVTGDGIPEIVTAPGKNHAPVIKVFTLDGVELPEYRFLAYAANFKGGVYVAVGDVLGDGLNDIVVTPASEGRGVNGLRAGGTEVRVYGNNLATSPDRPFVDNAPDRRFLAFPRNVVNAQFLGGGTVATGDVQPGGKLEVMVGSGPGIRATARAFNVEHGGAVAVTSWLPFDRIVRGGIFVSAGRIDGDAAADVVFGAWQGRDGLVEIRSGATGALLRPVLRPYVGLPRRVGSQSGLRVVARDLNGDGVIDRIIAGQGSDGRTKQVVQFGPLDARATDFLFENDPDFIGGFHLA